MRIYCVGVPFNISFFYNAAVLIIWVFIARFCYCDDKIIVLLEGTQHLLATSSIEETANMEGVSWDYYLEAIFDALPPKVASNLFSSPFSFYYIV